MTVKNDTIKINHTNQQLKNYIFVADGCYVRGLIYFQALYVFFPFSTGRRHMLCYQLIPHHSRYDMFCPHQKYEGCTDEMRAGFPQPCGKMFLVKHCTDF